MSFEKIKSAKKESASYMVDEITAIIKNFDKREPGSKGETDAINYMGELLKPYTDEVKVEPFDLHPGAFFGWIYISITLLLVGFICLFFLPIATIICFALAIFLMIGEFIMYRQVIDKLFKKKTSHNLTAIKRPTGEVKRRIFINGHPDAAYEWPVNFLFGGVGFGAHFVLTLFGVVYVFAIAVAALVIHGAAPMILNSGWVKIAALAGLAFMPFWIGMCFLWNERRVVDGANDNLTACLMGVAFMKAMKDNDLKLENTEVGVLLSGSEEAGLRGAKAWVKAHKNDYNDVETLIFAFDTIREAKFLSVNASDLNSTVKADKHTVDLFKNAADKRNIPCSIGSVPFGATDSAAFCQGGFKAAGITAMDHNLKDYYHTRRDTFDNLDAVCLADTFEILAQAIEDFDSGK